MSDSCNFVDKEVCFISIYLLKELIKNILRLGRTK